MTTEEKTLLVVMIVVLCVGVGYGLYRFVRSIRKTARLVACGRDELKAGRLISAREMFRDAAIQCVFPRFIVREDPLQASIDGLQKVYEMAGVDVDLEPMRRFQRDSLRKDVVSDEQAYLDYVLALPRLQEEIGNSSFERTRQNLLGDGNVSELSSHGDYAGGGWILTERDLVICGPITRIFELAKIQELIPVYSYAPIVGESYSLQFLYEGLNWNVRVPKVSFQCEVLDAYAAAKGYPGSPTCWFCWRQPGRDSNGITQVLHETLSRDVKTDPGWATVTQRYRSAEVFVPRCAECARLHSLLNWRIGQTIVGTLVTCVQILFVGITWQQGDNDSSRSPLLEWSAWCYPLFPILFLVLAICSAAFTIWLGTGQKRLLRSRDVRPIEAIRCYPPLNAMWKQGFRFGDKPGLFESRFGKPIEG